MVKRKFESRLVYHQTLDRYDPFVNQTPCHQRRGVVGTITKYFQDNPKALMYITWDQIHNYNLA
jgi:hypothetical protein